MRHILIGALGSVSLLVAGCSAGGSAPSERVEQQQDAIFKGQLDTTHQAVVALYTQIGNQSGLCTGTIVAVKGNKGFVLTAAHCVDEATPQLVLMGNDVAAQSVKQFTVTDAKAHPSYNGLSQGGAYDFAMVTFVGATASTPTIAPMTKETDNLKKGSVVNFIGYGRTENNDNNSKRFRVLGALDQVTALQVAYDQTNGGPCQGDSGGPSLSTINSVELVSSVTSYGDQDCTNYGASGRVSAVYDSFIKPYIDGTTAVLTCDECSQASSNGGVCAAAAQKCAQGSGTDCDALLTCANACPTNDQACSSACVDAHAQGYQDYLAIISCTCETACKAECGAEDFCQAPAAPTCGLAFADATCNTCNESKCCDVTQACNDDIACRDCATGETTVGCDTNTKYTAFSQCVSTQCSNECGGGQTGCGFTFAAPNFPATCGACAETSCCDVQKNCVDDASCVACATGESTTGCSTNTNLQALFACINGPCGEACGTGSAGAGGSGAAGSGAAGTGAAGKGTAGTGSSAGGTTGTGAAGNGAGSGGSDPAGEGGSDPTGEGGSDPTGEGGSGGDSSEGEGGSGTAGKGAAGKGAAGKGGLLGGGAGVSSSEGGASASIPESSSSSDGGCSVAQPSGASSLSGLVLGLAALLGLRRRR